MKLRKNRDKTAKLTKVDENSGPRGYEISFVLYNAQYSILAKLSHIPLPQRSYSAEYQTERLGGTDAPK
jgi:hypothetical protein